MNRLEMEEELAALGYDLESLGFWSDQAIEMTYNAETNNADLELETCGLVGQRYKETRSRIGSLSLCPPILNLGFGKSLLH